MHLVHALSGLGALHLVLLLFLRTVRTLQHLIESSLILGYLVAHDGGLVSYDVIKTLLGVGKILRK